MNINKPVSTVLLIIITALFLFLFAIPEYKKSVGLKAKIIQKQAEYNGKSVYYANISELVTDIKARQEALDKVDSSLPDEFSLSPLMYFFQQKAAESGLISKSILFAQVTPRTLVQPSSAAPGKEIKDIMFTLELVGNYQGLKNFIYALERSSRIIEVDSIEMKSLQAGRGPAIGQMQAYDITMDVKTHSY